MRRLIKNAVFGASLTACISQGVTSEHVGTQSSSIIEEEHSTADEDYVMLVSYKSKQDNTSFMCSSVLVAPRTLVTARHCVSRTLPTVSCGPAPPQQENVHEDRDAENYTIYAGRSYDDIVNTRRFFKVSRIFHGGGNTICDDDIAVLTLKDDFSDVQVPTISVDLPALDKYYTAVGWGRTLSENNPQRRGRRDDIKRVSNNSLGPAEFATTEGTCSGDSGGPLIDDDRLVYGVLSRGSHITPDPSDKRPGASCVGSHGVYTHIYSKIKIVQAALKETGDIVKLSDGTYCDFTGCGRDMNELVKNYESTCKIGRGKTNSLLPVAILCLGVLIIVRRLQRKSAPGPGRGAASLCCSSSPPKGRCNDVSR